MSSSMRQQHFYQYDHDVVGVGVPDTQKLPTGENRLTQQKLMRCLNLAILDFSCCTITRVTATSCSIDGSSIALASRSSLTDVDEPISRSLCKLR